MMKIEEEDCKKDDSNDDEDDNTSQSSCAESSVTGGNLTHREGNELATSPLRKLKQLER